MNQNAGQNQGQSEAQNADQNAGQNAGQIIVAGHICLDLVPAFEQESEYKFSEMFVPGRLIHIGESVLSSGGAVSNTGIALKQLGFSVQLMGKIGDDLFGKGVQDVLALYRENLKLIIDPKTSTSYSYVIAPPGVDRIFLHHPGANDTFCMDDLDFEGISKARLFHFGYPPLMRRMYTDNGIELSNIMRHVKERNVTTSLDLALPDPESDAGQADWLQILTRTLPFTDIFFPSLEEILYMLERPVFDAVTAQVNATGINFIDAYDMTGLAALSERIIELGASIVVIKLGKKGLYMRTAGTQKLADAGKGAPADPEEWSGHAYFAPSYSVKKIASTAGAGDASIAGVLAGILSGQQSGRSLQLGCAVAAQKIQIRKSFGGIEPLSSLLTQLNDWKQDEVKGIPANWTYDPGRQIWNA